MKKKRVIIMGAGGRDMHNFTTYFRDNELYEVVAFTATQVPFLAGRDVPPEVAGPNYPNGIHIYDDSELEVISIDVSVADTLSALRAYREQEQIPWRMAMDPGGLVNDYAVGALPTVIIIDKDGYVVNIIRTLTPPRAACGPG